MISKKHRNIEKIRIGSIELIRFGSVRYSKKVLEFHCSFPAEYYLRNRYIYYIYTAVISSFKIYANFFEFKLHSNLVLLEQLKGEAFKVILYCVIKV